MQGLAEHKGLFTDVKERRISTVCIARSLRRPTIYMFSQKAALLLYMFGNGPPKPCYFRGPLPLAVAHETIS